MSPASQETVHSLRKLGEAIEEKERILDELASYGTEEEYIEQVVGSSPDNYVYRFLPPPDRRISVSPYIPDKERLIKVVCGFGVALILAVLLVVHSIISCNKQIIISDIQSNPGDAYNNWLTSFGTVNSFEELEDGWAAVEADWSNRGIDVGWDVVQTIKDENFHFGIIHASKFDTLLMRAVEDMGTDMIIIIMLVTATIAAVISAIILCIRAISEYIQYRKDEMNYVLGKKQMEEDDLYNQQQRIKWNEEADKLRQEYTEKAHEARETYSFIVNMREKEMRPVEETISTYGHILPQEFHGQAYLIASLIEEGKATTVEEAIRNLPRYSFCEDDIE